MRKKNVCIIINRLNGLFLRKCHKYSRTRMKNLKSIAREQTTMF